MSSTFLGVPADEAVGEAVLMSDGTCGVYAMHSASRGHRLLCTSAIDDADYYDDDGVPFGECYAAELDGYAPERAICFLSRPNPMDRAPRCGKPVLLRQELRDIAYFDVGVWSARYCQWVEHDESVTGLGRDAAYISWLPIPGQTYDPARMGGPDV